MSDPSSEAALDSTEPSMEDILASIREIIAVDDSASVEAPLSVVEDEGHIDVGNVTDLLGHSVPETPSLETPSLETPSLETPSLETQSHIASDAIGSDVMADVNMGDFDLDSELSDMVELEIPELEPETDLDLSQMQDIADDQSPALETAAMAAASAVAIGGAAKAASSFSAPSPDFEITDIDNELSALLNSTLDTDEITDATGDAINLSDVMPDMDLPDVDLTQDDTLDMDLASMMDDVMDDVETPSDMSLQSDEGGAVSDQELDSLLNDLNGDVPDDLSADFASEEVEIADIAFEDTLTTEIDAIKAEEDADLLLVKSLMADLVDDGNPASDEVTDVVLDTPDDAAEDVNLENLADFEALDGDVQPVDISADMPADMDNEAQMLSDIPDMMDGEDTSIMDDILDMAIADQEASSALADDGLAIPAIPAIETIDEVASLELENIAQNTDLQPEVFTDLDLTSFEELEAEASDMSLTGIAAAARADANAIDGFAGAGKLAAGAVLAGVAGAAISKAAPQDLGSEDDIDQMLNQLLDDSAASLQDDNHIDDSDAIEHNEVTEIDAQDETNLTAIDELEILKENSDMPRAATTNVDVIMDDVTEKATSSVFAELNHVVEEKAVVAERGDRIGDLVMEALRPMLKDWLDANLKGIVERAVAKEVKRISAGK